MYKQFDPVQDYEEWLLTHRFILGADGEGEEDPEASATGGEGEGSGEGEGEVSPGEGETEGGEGEEESNEDEADLDELDRVKRERDTAREQIARAEAAARKAKEDAKKAREDAAKKDGNWEQIARERQAELEEVNERVTKAETRAYEAETELDTFKREVRVTRLAQKLSFRDTNDAVLHLKDAPEATGDDKSCERALRKLGEEKPYLIDMKRARGRSMNGGGTGARLTSDQLRNMSPDEINAHWEKVSADLQSGAVT